jgi:hypothetical protein
MGADGLALLLISGLILVGVHLKRWISHRQMVSGNARHCRVMKQLFLQLAGVE